MGIAAELRLDRFSLLKTAPRELWIVYFLKFADSFGYALMSYICVLYLSADVGLGDADAQFLYGTWVVATAALTFFIGPLTDSIGVRNTFFVSFIINLMTRFIITFFTNAYIVFFVGLIPMTLSIAFMNPVMTAAIKKYTETRQRSLGFSVFYVVMNLAFLFAGLIIDYVRSPEVMGEYGKAIIPILGITLSSYQVIFFIGFLFTLPAFLIMWLFMRDDFEIKRKRGRIRITKAPRLSLQQIVIIGEVTFWHSIAIFKEVVREKSFHRFLLLLFLLVGIKLTFFHMHVTFPKYTITMLGEGAKFGNVWGALNPAIIIFLVPLVGAFTHKIDPFKLILVGSSISAFGISLIVFPFKAWEWLIPTPVGHFILHTWLNLSHLTVKQQSIYISLVIFIFIYSIGEAIWSPKLFEYAALVSPLGKESSYMSLSLLPMFVTKFFLGPVSGYGLHFFVNNELEKTRIILLMWVGITVFGAFGAIILRKIINPHGVG